MKLQGRHLSVCSIIEVLSLLSMLSAIITINDTVVGNMVLTLVSSSLLGPSIKN